MRKLPDFLEDIVPGVKFVQTWEPLMRSWMILHNALVIRRDDMTMQHYAKLMVLELQRDTPRKDILVRLKGKFDIKRREIESSSLVK